MSDAATMELDAAKMEAFGGKMLGILNGASASLMISVGHQVGLFDTMAGMPSSTSAEIALAAGLNERYVREWLGAMATAGIVEYDSGHGGFRLPPEHAALTTRAAGPNNFASFMQFIPVCAAVENEVVDHFRHGGGVPYTSYARFHAVMAEISGSIFDTTLVGTTLPLVPGLVERLEQGIDVLDVGTGSGHAINVMAKAFPKSRFVGVDFTDSALDVGRAEAAAWGLTNASFVARDAAKLDMANEFDFVTTFDAVHDQAHPAEMVRSIFDAVRPGGYWLCVDIQASTHIGENLSHQMGPFFYSVSCMHCMTVSLAYDGVGLGAMWGVQQARAMFADAGFDHIDIRNVEGDAFNNYYVCHKPG